MPSSKVVGFNAVDANENTEQASLARNLHRLSERFR